MLFSLRVPRVTIQRFGQPESLFNGVCEQLLRVTVRQCNVGGAGGGCSEHLTTRKNEHGRHFKGERELSMEYKNSGDLSIENNK